MWNFNSGWITVVNLLNGCGSKLDRRLRTRFRIFRYRYKKTCNHRKGALRTDLGNASVEKTWKRGRHKPEREAFHSVAVAALAQESNNWSNRYTPTFSCWIHSRTRLRAILLRLRFSGKQEAAKEHEIARRFMKATALVSVSLPSGRYISNGRYRAGICFMDNWRKTLLHLYEYVFRFQRK